MPQARRQPAVDPHAIDPRVCDLIERAQREHFKMGVCTACGGSEVYAKTQPAARCLRCGRHRTLDSIAPHPKRHRCLACRKIFWSVVNWQKCEQCRAKSTESDRSQVPGFRGAVTPKTALILRADSAPISAGPDPVSRKRSA